MFNFMVIAQKLPQGTSGTNNEMTEESWLHKEMNHNAKINATKGCFDRANDLGGCIGNWTVLMFKQAFVIVAIQNQHDVHCLKFA